MVNLTQQAESGPLGHWAGASVSEGQAGAVGSRKHAGEAVSRDAHKVLTKATLDSYIIDHARLIACNRASNVAVDGLAKVTNRKMDTKSYKSETNSYVKIHVVLAKSLAGEICFSSFMWIFRRG